MILTGRIAPALREPLRNHVLLTLAGLLAFFITAHHNARLQTELQQVRQQSQRLEQARTASELHDRESHRLLGDMGSQALTEIPPGVLPANAWHGPLETCGADERHWEKHCIRVQMTVAHELPLLATLARWQSLSPGQHQLAACRITRHDDGLLGDCRLLHFRLRPPQ